MSQLSYGGGSNEAANLWYGSFHTLWRRGAIFDFAWLRRRAELLDVSLCYSLRLRLGVTHCCEWVEVEVKILKSKGSDSGDLLSSRSERAGILFVDTLQYQAPITRSWH